ncbi:MAG: hypothetical protein M0Q91_05465 [Methanoregula sp.]|jgi:hypothetical protein|nr:hypothetical protein [Methanoregula sp.]
MTEGTLTDKGMNDDGVWIARIDDKPYPVLGYVLPFLEKVEKGAWCEYTLKDGKVSKISKIKNNPQGTPAGRKGVVDVAGDAVDKAKEKMAKAGFGQPAEQGKPTDGLPKTVEGKLSVINTEARTFNLWREDFKITISWIPSQDSLMAKFKQWDKVKVTYEVGTPNRLVDIVNIASKKGDWQPKKPRVTIAATVNLQNYENIKVEVEGNNAEECTKILIDTLNGFAKNPAYSTTRDMIQSYLMRVLNTKGGA